MLRLGKPSISILYYSNINCNRIRVSQIRCFASESIVNKKHPNRIYFSPMQSIKCVRNCAKSKIDETFEVVASLNIDPTKTNQIVRGMLTLPHGNGQHPRIAVFADGKYAEDAKEAGAEVIGLDDLINNVKAGKIDFDIAITTPKNMSRLSSVAKILGPKKLMPSARSGTVSEDITKAVKEALRGNKEIKPDKSAAVKLGIGKLSFSDEQLCDNLKEFVIQLSTIKPPTAKNFVDSVCVCSSQGPAFFLDMRFISPGRFFFNEELADAEAPIPEKVVRLSTRKRHALMNTASNENSSK